MKRLFISQPTNGKDFDEIFEERKNAIASAKEILKEEVIVANAFCDTLGDSSQNPLFLLGESLKRLATADAVYFVPGWENVRGCRIEHECAEMYGLNIIN